MSAVSTASSHSALSTKSGGSRTPAGKSKAKGKSKDKKAVHAKFVEPPPEERVPEEVLEEADDAEEAGWHHGPLKEESKHLKEEAEGHRPMNLARITQIGAEFYNHMIAADIENKVTEVSPQIAVIWFSYDSPDFQKAFDSKALVIASPLLKLPLTDRTIFVVERPEHFLSHHSCGSVAAEMESLRFTLSEKLTSLGKDKKADDALPGQDQMPPATADSNKSVAATADSNRSVAAPIDQMAENYFMWPLHDMKFNRQLLTKLALSEGSTHENIDKLHKIPLDLAKRLVRFMGLVSAKEADLLGALQAHFGSDVALDFLFTTHYIRFSWVLAAFALIFHIIKQNVEHSTYRAYVSPVFQFMILIPWSIFFTVAWRQQVKSVASTWINDILENDSKYANDSLPDFVPWDPDVDKDYYPNWMRAIRTLPMVPLIMLDLLLMMAVLGTVFWAEMYIVFEWGECARINAENGNTECQSADQVHGFMGWLWEAIPGLCEGLAFELLLALSRLLARLACWLQNWRTQTDKDLAYIFQLVVFEFIGKFGWILALAVIFVPDWEGVGLEKQMGTHRYDETQCTPPASENMDSRFFSVFNSRENSISCLKTRTQYETRLLLFEGAVAAPFWVSQLVSLAIKTLVPSLVVRCRQCFVNDHGRQGGCPCKCGRVCLRCLSCMCLLDTGNMNVSDCEYMSAGDTVGSELFAELYQQEEIVEPPFYKDKYKESDRILLATAWKEGIREAYQPLDENIETGMHFFWVIAFGAFYPLGILLGVVVFVFDIRSDYYRLTIVQQRNFRKPPQASLIMLFNFMRVAVGFAAIFNAIYLFVTYMVMSRWSDQPKYDQDRGLYHYFWRLMGMIAVTSIVQIIFQLCVLHFTRSFDAEHLETQSAVRERVRTSGESMIPLDEKKQQQLPLFSPIQVGVGSGDKIDRE